MRRFGLAFGLAAAVALFAGAARAAAPCTWQAGVDILNKPMPTGSGQILNPFTGQPVPADQIHHLDVDPKLAAHMFQTAKDGEAMNHYYRCLGTEKWAAYAAVVQLWARQQAYRQQMWPGSPIEQSQLSWISTLLHYMPPDAPDCLHKIIDNAGIPIHFDWRTVGPNEQVDERACILWGGDRPGAPPSPAIPW